MSKWKDTVMGDEEILSKEAWLSVGILAHNAMARKNDREIETSSTLLLCRRIAKAQAKKAWPVAHKAGIREVVEWIRENSWDGSLQHFGSGNYRVQCVPPDDWLAKLKEWGI